jgi:hypothetical protein
MTSRFFERRSFRNQLKKYLEDKGWSELTWAESFTNFAAEEIIPPYIGITLIDFGKSELEMGNDPTKSKLYSRRAQVNIYMENEDRTDALEDDISDFMDIEVIIIKDNNNNILGSMNSDTESIISDTQEPDMEESNLRWRGIVACMYEIYYPEG